MSCKCYGSTSVSKTEGGGSTPSRDAKFRIATANIKNLFLKKSQKMLSCLFLSGYIVSQVRRLALEVRGRRFESYYPDQFAELV